MNNLSPIPTDPKLIEAVILACQKRIRSIFTASTSKRQSV
jgi:hypothetical protein